MIKKTAEISITSNSKQVADDVDELGSKVDDLGVKTDSLTSSNNRNVEANKKTTDALKNHTSSLKGNGIAILENGGAMGILNDLTGGIAMTIKDLVESTQLFTTTTEVSTVATEAQTIATGTSTVVTEVNTVATVSSNTARQQSTLLKIKDAIATGLSTVATGALTAATYVVTAAQWLWNVAVKNNPLVALAVAITAVVTGLVIFTKYLIDSSAANDAATKATIRNTKALEDQSVQAERSKNALKIANEQQFKMAQAAGASTESLRKLISKHIEEEIALNKKTATIARDTFIRERNTLATLKSADASDEVIAAQEKLTQSTYKEFQEQNKALDTSYKQRAQMRRDNEVAITKERTDATNKANEATKQAREKAKNDLIAQQKAELAEIKKLQDEARLANKMMLLTDQQQEIKTIQDKYDKELTLFKKHGKDTNELDIQYLNQKNDVNLKYQKIAKDKADADAKIIEEKKKADAQVIKDLLDSYEVEKAYADTKSLQEVSDLEIHNFNKLEAQRKADEERLILAGATAEQLATMNASYKERELQNAKDASEQRANLEKNKYIAITNFAKSGQDIMSSLETLGIIKSKAARNIQKGIVLSQLASDSAQAISSAIPMAISIGKNVAAVSGPAGSVLGPLATATSLVGSLATVAKNVARAKATLAGGGTGGDSGGGSASAGGGSASAPASVPYQNTPQTQIADSINQASANRTNTIKAYVVGSEITDRQQLDNRISDSAKF